LIDFENAESERALPDHDDVPGMHVQRFRRLALKNRTKIKDLGALLTADNTNHAHFTESPKLVGAAGFHDGLQDGGGPVKRILPGLLHGTADHHRRDAALQRHNYGRVLELRFVEGLQRALKISNRSATRSNLPNEGQVNFSVGLDRLRLAQFSGPRETHLDHIPRRQCHRHPSQRLIREVGGNSGFATGKGQKNEKKKATAESETVLPPLRETLPPGRQWCERKIRVHKISNSRGK